MRENCICNKWREIITLINHGLRCNKSEDIAHKKHMRRCDKLGNKWKLEHIKYMFLCCHKKYMALI